MARSSTRTELFALAAAFGLAAAGCSDSDGGKAGGRSPPAAEPVVVTVSVDWEGAYFDAEGLAAMARFRDENPGVPITHFVCPAYYTKPSADRADVTDFLEQNIRPEDEVGVHLHAWNSLVQAASVPIRTGRSFLTEDGRLLEFVGDAGFDIDPSIYTVSELRAMLATSRKLLESAGLKVAPVFRAGGWLARENVLEAARAEGFLIDSSAIDATWLGEGDSSDGFEYLAARIREVWPNVDRTSQPFSIDTPAGRIFEMPDTGAMADHLSSEEMEDHVQWASRARRRPMFVQLGFHAETAHAYADLLSRALGHLRRRNVPMQFVTVSKGAELAKRGSRAPAPDP